LLSDKALHWLINGGVIKQKQRSDHQRLARAGGPLIAIRKWE
jgi:hypothetical protein